jgi:hypothetical protein
MRHNAPVSSSSCSKARRVGLHARYVVCADIQLRPARPQPQSHLPACTAVLRYLSGAARALLRACPRVRGPGRAGLGLGLGLGLGRGRRDARAVTALRRRPRRPLPLGAPALSVVPLSSLAPGVRGRGSSPVLLAAPTCERLPVSLSSCAVSLRCLAALDRRFVCPSALAPGLFALSSSAGDNPETRRAGRRCARNAPSPGAHSLSRAIRSLTGPFHGQGRN